MKVFFLLCALGLATIASAIPADFEDDLLFSRAVNGKCKAPLGTGTCQHTAKCPGVSYPTGLCPKDPKDVQVRLSYPSMFQFALTSMTVLLQENLQCPEDWLGVLPKCQEQRLPQRSVPRRFLPREYGYQMLRQERREAADEPKSSPAQSLHGRCIRQAPFPRQHIHLRRRQTRAEPLLFQLERRRLQLFAR